jgi:ubiquitin C-terminal hydrolase
MVEELNGERFIKNLIQVSNSENSARKLSIPIIKNKKIEDSKNSIKSVNEIVSLDDPVNRQETDEAPILVLKRPKICKKKLNLKNPDSPKKQSNLTSLSEEFIKSFQTMIKPSNTNNKISVWCSGNMSNINSALQFFLLIPELQEYFIEQHFLGNFKGKVLSGILSKFFITKACMQTGIIDSSFVKNYVLNNRPQIQIYNFIDLIRFVIDEVSSEFHPSSLVLTNLFKGKKTREKCCLVCSKRYNDLEDFTDLSLEVSISLERSLEIFNREDRALNYCINCDNSTNFSERVTITYPPNYLLISFKRFVQMPFLRKNNLFVKIKKNLKVADNDYKLVHAIVHEGEISDGHYISYSKQNRKWYQFIDKKVSKVSFADLYNSNILVLLYKKVMINDN